MDAPHQTVFERLVEHFDGLVVSVGVLAAAAAGVLRHIFGRRPGQVFEKVRHDPHRETRIVPRPESAVDQKARDDVIQLRAQVKALETAMRVQADEFRRADEAIVDRVESSNSELRQAVLGLTEKVGELVGLSRRRRLGEEE